MIPEGRQKSKNTTRTEDLHKRSTVWEYGLTIGWDLNRIRAVHLPICLEYQSIVVIEPVKFSNCLHREPRKRLFSSVILLNFLRDKAGKKMKLSWLQKHLVLLSPASNKKWRLSVKSKGTDRRISERYFRSRSYEEEATQTCPKNEARSTARANRTSRTHAPADHPVSSAYKEFHQICPSSLYIKTCCEACKFPWRLVF